MVGSEARNTITDIVKNKSRSYKLFELQINPITKKINSS